MLCFKMVDASMCLEHFNVASMFTFLFVSSCLFHEKSVFNKHLKNFSESEELLQLHMSLLQHFTWTNVDYVLPVDAVVVGSCVGGGVCVMFCWTRFSVVKVSDIVSHSRGVWFNFHPPVNFRCSVLLLNSACLFSTDAGWHTSVMKAFLWWWCQQVSCQRSSGPLGVYHTHTHTQISPCTHSHMYIHKNIQIPWWKKLRFQTFLDVLWRFQFSVC